MERTKKFKIGFAIGFCTILLGVSAVSAQSWNLYTTQTNPTVHVGIIDWTSYPYDISSCTTADYWQFQIDNYDATQSQGGTVYASSTTSADEDITLTQGQFGQVQIAFSDSSSTDPDTGYLSACGGLTPALMGDNTYPIFRIAPPPTSTPDLNALINSQNSTHTKDITILIIFLEALIIIYIWTFRHSTS